MKTTRFLAVILSLLLMVLSGNTLCADANTSVTTQRSLTHKLVDTAGEVLLEAAEFGLDWAGEKLLGTKGWSGFKRILRPVVVRLQEKFPALKFGRPDDARAAEAAKEAVAYLKNSQELSSLLAEGFMSLEEGQQDILASIDRLEQLVRAQHEEEMRLLRQMSEQLSHGGQLPRRIDVSDTVDRLYWLSKVRARREGRDFNENISGLVAAAAGAGVFTLRVLEEGRPFVRYETNIANTKWFATPSSRFQDEAGRPCRRLTTDSPVWGEPGKRTSVYSKYCQIEGYWKQVELLERREYFAE